MSDERLLGSGAPRFVKRANAGGIVSIWLIVFARLRDPGKYELGGGLVGALMVGMLGRTGCCWLLDEPLGTRGWYDWGG